MCNEGSEKLILSNKNTDKITRNNNYYYYHNLNNTNYSLSKNRKSNSYSTSRVTTAHPQPAGVFIIRKILC